MEDTLKISLIGMAGTAASGLGVFPDIVSFGVGVLTAVYLVIKIGNELNKKENR
tara:strand:+ start:2109 stop:2270 length:162 start_codon:yes stop_codon:yes gene_type:complete